MEFKKYMHIERLGTDEVEDIQFGECYVFYKIDGTNASVWLDDEGNLKAGSRTRELTLEKDNAGFYAYVLENEKIKAYLSEHPNHRLYGEWLCLSGDTLIRKTSAGKNSQYMTLKEMYEFKNKKIVDTQKWKNKKGEQIKKIQRTKSWWEKNGMPSIFSLYLDEDKIKPNKIKDIMYSGKKDVYEVTTRKGFKIKAAMTHPFFTPNGFKKLEELKENDCVAVTDFYNKRKKRTYGNGTNNIFKKQNEYKNKIGKCEKCGNGSCLELHHIDNNHKNNNEDNFMVLCKDCHKKMHNSQKFKGFEYNYEFDKIISIKYIGMEDCYDISMEGTENEMNFVANGFIVHNCPHSLKTYRKDAWFKFYIFDVSLEVDDHEELLPYEVYKGMLDKYELDYVPPLAILKNAGEDSFIKLLDKTGQFLVEDGKGNGEGIVIKNYSFVNKYGRQTWAKIVANEFKEVHAKAMGASIVTSQQLIEDKIVAKYCTEAFIEKEYAKIVNQMEGWRSQYIPMLLGRVYSEFIKEESWNFIKEFKNPKINFKTLQSLVYQKVKETKKELFN